MTRIPPGNLQDMARQAEFQRKAHLDQSATETARATSEMAQIVREQHAENTQLRLLTAVLSIAVIADLLIAAQTSSLGAWRVIVTVAGAVALYGLLRSLPPVWRWASSKVRARRADSNQA